MTLGNVSTYIEGVGLSVSWRDRRHNLSELIFETVRSAIDDAGKGLDGIDSVILAAHDLVDGRSLSSMVTAPAAGAYLRDETRYSDDSAGAFAAAVTRIEAGESDRLIVAAWGRSSEHNVDAVSRVLFDPVFMRPLGIEELHISAMRAQNWRQRFRADEATAAAGRRLACAQINPRALKDGGWRSAAPYPLVADDLPLWADVVAAVVLSRVPSPLKVAGFGQSSEPYFIGDRDLSSMPALRLAAQRAYANAGCSAADIDIVEVDGLTVYDEAIGLEAIGFVPQGQGLCALAADARINPSGGSASGYCAPTMGLARIVEAALQIQGRAGPTQQGRPRRAIATGSSVVAAQTQTAVILEAA